MDLDPDLAQHLIDSSLHHHHHHHHHHIVIMPNLLTKQTKDKQLP